MRRFRELRYSFLDVLFACAITGFGVYYVARVF